MSDVTVTVGGVPVDREGWLLRKPLVRTLARGRRYKQRWVAVVGSTVYILDKGTAAAAAAAPATPTSPGGNDSLNQSATFSSASASSSAPDSPAPTSRRRGQVEVTIELSGCTVRPGSASKSHKYTLEITEPPRGGAADKEVVHTFAATSEKERDAWIKALGDALSRPPNDSGPPRSDWATSTSGTFSLKMKAEKRLASAALDTRKGRAYLRQQVPDDSAFMIIFQSFVGFLGDTKGSKFANEFEKNAMKLLAKAVILDKYDRLSPDDMLPGLTPMLSFCEVTQDTDDADPAAACRHLRDLGQCATVTLTPHLSPRSLERLADLFATLCDVDLVTTLLTDAAHRPRADAITGQIARIYPTLRAEVWAVRETDAGKRALARELERGASKKEQAPVVPAGSRPRGNTASGMPETVAAVNRLSVAAGEGGDDTDAGNDGWAPSDGELAVATYSSGED